VTSKSNKLKIVLITGSVRSGSLTTAAASIIAQEMTSLGCDVSVIDPKEVRIASLGERFPADLSKKYTDLVLSSNGVILCTPEYNGSYSSVLKAVIEAIGFPSPLDGKFIGLVGIASGRIGAIKALEHLRSVCSHCGGMVLPFALSIKEAHLVLDSSGQCQDPEIKSQLREVAVKMLEAVS